MCTTLCEMPTETTLLSIYKCRLFSQNEWGKGHSDSQFYYPKKKKKKKKKKKYKNKKIKK